MNILLIDPQQSGISGDMLLAGLTDVFQAHDKINSFLEKIITIVDGVEAKYAVETMTKNNISGSILKFSIGKDIKKSNVKELLILVDSLLDKVLLSEKAQNFVKDVFDLILTSESSIHGYSSKETDKMHFHELNSIDSIIDVIGVAFLIDHFYNWDRAIIGLPVSNGTGTISFSHGEFSLPAPAVSKILAISNYPNFHINVPFELTTVTGIALLSKLVTEQKLTQILHRKIKTGIGHGQQNIGKRANIINIQLIEALNAEKELSISGVDEIVVLESHVDDLSGEILGQIIQEFQTDSNVLDISIYNLIMKKNRPGHCIRILCSQENKHKLTEKLIRNTGTLGVRISPVQRHIAIREIQTKKILLDNKEYEIRVKIAKFSGNIINIKPEFDDLKELSRKLKIPMKELSDLIVSQIKRS